MGCGTSVRYMETKKLEPTADTAADTTAARSAAVSAALAVIWKPSFTALMAQVCGVCGMPTVHAPVTVPALSKMLLTALMVNGNTSLRCLRHVYGTSPVTAPALSGRLRLYGHQALPFFCVTMQIHMQLDISCISHYTTKY